MAICPRGDHRSSSIVNRFCLRAPVMEEVWGVGIYPPHAVHGWAMDSTTDTFHTGTKWEDANGEHRVCGDGDD